MNDDPKQLGKCVRCDKAVMSLGNGMQSNPNDAMEGVVYGNYGSRHDMSTLKVWLCDDCAQPHADDMQVA